MRIAVIGGTGEMGRLMVDQARAAGHEVVVLARSTGADISTGTGLDDALAGVEVVVDVSDNPAREAEVSIAFFETAAANIAEAERKAGVSHHVLMSIVNCDAPELRGFGYYQGKAAQERAVKASGVPFTIVRSTQWFEFGEKVVGRMGKGPVALVPRMRSQPMAAKTVAAELISVAVSRPSGAVVEFAGPDVLDIPAMTRTILAHRGTRKLLIPVSVPKVGAAMKSGALLPGPGATIAGPTLQEWLDEN